MTREEAIKIVQSATVWTDEEREALAMLIPELAESEDERMYARVTGRYTRFEKYYLRALGETEANKVLKQCEEEELWIKNLLEKQKESLHISETCKENPNSFTNEDERIRKGMIDEIKAILRGEDLGFPPQDVLESRLAYLEKQKEPVVDKEGMYYYLGGKFIYCGYPATEENPYDFAMSQQEKQKEQKPVDEQFPPLEGLDAIKAKYYDDGFKNLFDEGVESVKPEEWSDDFKENIRILLHNKLTWHSEDGRMSSTVFINDKTLKDIINGIWFYVGKEALKYPNKELNVTEWSEKDEKMLENIRYSLRYAYFNSVIDEQTTEYVMDWLKSLRPQPKEEWSEEDENIYNKALDAIYYKDCNEKDDVISALNDLCDLISRKRKVIPPYARWTPSEEQMEALDEYIYAKDPNTEKYSKAVLSLRDELKKLM